jgi:tRNA(Arg) A34 adenosine deaminase TadA
MTEADERHLRRAVELAAAARVAGDMPYGSLLVGPTGDVLAEDRNTVVTEQDITAHPELKPTGAVSPDAAQVAYEGPALFAEARVPIDGYYA